MFEHCKKCVKPQRYPGCHDHCPYHAEDKAKFEQQKAADKKRRGRSTPTVYQQMIDAHHRVERARHRKKRY